MINASLGAHYDGSFVWQSMMLWWQTLLGIKHQESADELQQKLSNTFGGKVVLTYKGRDAIELALRGYGLTSNKDVVLTQAFTCFAIEEAIVRAGAKPVYVDLAKDQLNFNVKSLQAAGKKHGKNVKAVIVQHGLGHPAEIDKIREWCNRQGVLVIEDLAQSFGAAGAGKPLGSFGDAVILSFGRDKVIDAVTGGAVIFRTPAKNNQLSFLPPAKGIILKDLAYPFFTWLIRNTYFWLGLGKLIHRLLTIAVLMGNPTQAPTQTITALPGGVAKLALTQLQTLEKNLQHRRKTAKLYLQELQSLPGKIITTEADTQYGTILRFVLTTDDPQALLSFWKKHGIHLTDRWYRSPVDCGNLQCDTSYQSGTAPRAEKMSQTVINLPTHSKINQRQAEKIIAVTKKFFKNKK